MVTKRSIAILMMAALISLVGCAEEKDADPYDYAMPQDFELQTFEIETDRFDKGIELEQHIIEGQDPDAWKQENFDRWLIQKEAQEALDEYISKTSAWERMDADKQSYLAHEKRIQEYCDEYGFAACFAIDRACDEDGCRKVTITCDDDDYDEKLDYRYECSGADVKVDRSIDDELTARENYQGC